MRTSNLLPEECKAEEIAMEQLLRRIAEIPPEAWDRIEFVSGNPRLGMSTTRLVLNDQEG